MKRLNLALPAIALAFAADAAAAETKFNLSSDYVDYSGTHGNRHENSLEATSDFGATAVVLSGTHGRRKFGAESFSAVKASATVYQDWTDRFHTRTQVAVSSNDPVFANREVAQDLSYKPVHGLTVTAGGKYARYHGNTDVYSWSLGGSAYLPGMILSYRYSSYDIERLGDSHGHLASLRLRDPKGSGSTQLWVGSGTSLHEDEPFAAALKGKQRGVMLQRVQPIGGGVALVLGAGRTWYSTDLNDYTGTRATLGFTYAARRLFK